MDKAQLNSRYGVQVLEGLGGIPETFKYLAERGIRTIEINLNNPYFFAQFAAAPERAEIAKIVDGEGINWVAHMPEGVGFFEVEDQVFGRYLTFLVYMQGYAKQMGCKALTVHMGAAPAFAYSGQRRQGLDLFREYYETNLLVRLRRVVNQLRKGPPVCFENVAGFHQKQVRDILERIDGLYYTMDIGHLKVAHPRIADAEFDFFKENSKNIKVVHVHDNGGEWDEHLPVTSPDALEPYYSFGRDETDAYLIMEVRPLEAAVSSLAVLSGVEG